MKIVFDICISFTGDRPHVFMSFYKELDLPALPVVGTRIIDGEASFSLDDVEFSFNTKESFYRIDAYEKFEFKNFGKSGVRRKYEAFVNAGWQTSAHGRGLWPIIENE